MTDFAQFNANTGSLVTLRRLAGLQRVFKTSWRRRGTQPLSAEALRDSGARRAVQGYASAAPLDAATSRRLHRIAEAAQWGLPRP